MFEKNIFCNSTPHTPHLKCHISHATPHNSHVTPHNSHATQITLHTPHLTRHTSHLTHHTSPATPHTSHVTPHTSHLTHHTSQFTRHTSHVTPHTHTSYLTQTREGDPWYSGTALDCWSTGRASDPLPGAWSITIHTISPGCPRPYILLIKRRIVA